jgi:hypothetical protein
LHVASSFVRVEIPSSNGSLGFSHVWFAWFNIFVFKKKKHITI